jgi:hypothetical protein
LVAFGMLAGTMVSCEDSLCPAVTTHVPTPASAQLSVGQSINVSFKYSHCGNETRVTDITWSVLDTAIAVVDNVRDRVTARSPGSTFVHGNHSDGIVARIPLKVVP